MLSFVVACAVAALLWLSYTLIRARRVLQSPEPTRQEKENDAYRPEITPLEGLVWENEKPKQLRPFKPTYHITMALQADTPQELITIDSDYLSRVTLRRALIAQHGATVHGCTPPGRSAVAELYAYLLGTYLPARYPSVFQLTLLPSSSSSSTSSSALHNRATGKIHPTATPEDAAAALHILGETVEEDLFLLRETPRGHESTAFVCCFPSGFDPSTKLGRLLGEIHAPVPGYDKIARSMERFFAKLEVGRSVKRMNWSVQTHDELFNCKGNTILANDDSYTPDQDVDISKVTRNTPPCIRTTFSASWANSQHAVTKTFVRIELQTLTRLPQTRAILFSFKTYLYPVRQLRDEGGGPAFADAVDGLAGGNAPGMRIYKGSVRWGKAVCAYLRS